MAPFDSKRRKSLTKVTFYLILTDAYELRFKLKDLVFMYHAKASVIFLQTYSISCTELGVPGQPVGKAKCINALNNTLNR